MLEYAKWLLNMKNKYLITTKTTTIIRTNFFGLAIISYQVYYVIIKIHISSKQSTRVTKKCHNINGNYNNSKWTNPTYRCCILFQTTFISSSSKEEITCHFIIKISLTTFIFITSSKPFSNIISISLKILFLFFQISKVILWKNKVMNGNNWISFLLIFCSWTFLKIRKIVYFSH